MTIIERFLRRLGPDGRAGAKTLIDSRRFLPQDLTSAGLLTFKNTCAMLRDFTSLTTLSLTINKHYLFRNDQLALEHFFLRGQELNAGGLTSFQTVLQALPKLRNADIQIPDEYTTVRIDWSELTPSLRWALTRERRDKLCTASKAILETTKLQQKHRRVHVEYEVIWTYERAWEYEEWLANNGIAERGRERNSTKGEACLRQVECSEDEREGRSTIRGTHRGCTVKHYERAKDMERFWVSQ